MTSINWLSYKYIKVDGYGRYGMYMVRALSNAGVSVMPGTVGQFEDMPPWMQRLAGWDWSKLTVQCLPAFCLKPVPGRIWAYSMTEDTSCPEDWPDKINAIAERLIVPCEQNAAAFESRGVRCPIHVVHGGTSPDEFPILQPPRYDRPYTFICLADRMPRKGTEKVWSAFAKGFEGVGDVRLIMKARPTSLHWFNTFNMKDRRISIWKLDTDSMADVFAQGDCFVFPSHGEGWGMPPREAAMMGLPVIATRWSGLEIGIDQWAIPINNFVMGQAMLEHPEGQWAVPDLDELIAHMRWCYENQDAARAKGLAAARWLRENQTWEHSAQQLVQLMEKYS